MIVRDWQRLAWNLLLGSPLAYVVGLITLCSLVALPLIFAGTDASPVIAILIMGVPAVPLSYLFGIVPFLLISMAGSLIARFVTGELTRTLLCAFIGGIAAWWMAVVMVGPGLQFDSGDFNDVIIFSAPVGGFIAAFICAWITEHHGSRTGLPEGYL